MTRKNIFLKIDEYLSNPVTEYYKIYNFLKIGCVPYKSVYDYLFRFFRYSNSLTKRYSNFDECINDNTRRISEEDIYLSNEMFNKLDDNQKTILMDEFLTYCEILVHVFNISFRFDGSLSINPTYCQLINLIEGSLKSINYKIIVIDKENEIVEASKINPEAEHIADQSPVDIRKSIYRYLGCRQNDLEGRTTCLQNLIDSMKPIFNKYSTSLNAVNKAKEFSQLIRHRKEKCKETKYKWFYDELDIHLDEIFELCIFVLYYEKSHMIINEYDGQINKSNVEND